VYACKLHFFVLFLYIVGLHFIFGGAFWSIKML